MNPHNFNTGGYYYPHFDPEEFPNHPTQSPTLGFASFANVEPQVFSQTQPEVEYVPETQQPTRKTTKKKGKAVVEGSTSGPMAPKSWTQKEELILAKCYIDLSEDKEKGNSQKRDPFWLRVTERWHELMGIELGYRSEHQLNSKWKDLNKKISRWNGIYNNLNNQRPSGWSDIQVIKTAEEDYRLRTGGQKFVHYHVWNEIKDSPRWVPVPTEPSQGSKKRSKTSDDQQSQGSDARTTIYADLGLDDDSDDDEQAEPIRPGGRDKAKRERATKSTSSSSSTLASRLDEFNQIQMQKLKIKQEEIARKEKKEAEKALREDLKLMMASDDHLDPEQREIVKKMKEQIAAKYR